MTNVWVPGKFPPVQRWEVIIGIIAINIRPMKMRPN
jgi:hypothetical protein